MTQLPASPGIYLPASEVAACFPRLTRIPVGYARESRRGHLDHGTSRQPWFRCMYSQCLLFLVLVEEHLATLPACRASC